MDKNTRLIYGATMTYQARLERDARRFVAAWRKAKSLGEVCLKLGLKKSAACLRAQRYRAKGVRLQRFGHKMVLPRI